MHVIMFTPLSQNNFIFINLLHQESRKAQLQLQLWKVKVLRWLPQEHILIQVWNLIFWTIHKRFKMSKERKNTEI